VIATDLPLHAEVHPFRSGLGAHLLSVDGSRVYDIDSSAAASIEAALAGGPGVDSAVRAELHAAGLLVADPAERRIGEEPLEPPPLQSVSLNVAQACNMSCGYCYADEGRFGGDARVMDAGTGRAIVDRLIAESAPGSTIVVGYMGGEPLLNRRVVHEITRYADEAARAAGRRARFSITTNATVLEPEDARLFTEYPFTVSVSVDGNRARNDELRRMRGRGSAYDRMRAGLEVFEHHGRPEHLAARITVTPRTGPLVPLLDHVLSLGFDEGGFAAVVSSPLPGLAMGPEDFGVFLEQMVACGERALVEIRAGRPYPFGNLETALQEIHRGSHRPYPCGAGAAYLSANADGALFACHRLVDDEGFAMGSAAGGSDVAARADHLARRHVDRQEPCRTCWARYLCGGGCYHEVERRGRPGCDYIRGWLDFCLRAYVELTRDAPTYVPSAVPSTVEPVSSPTALT
jgi:uncharacterized protein